METPLVTSPEGVSLFALPTLKDNYTYLVASADGTVATSGEGGLLHRQELWVIDPGEAAPVIKWCEERSLRVTHILCTHHHPDHVDGAAELKEHFGAAIWCSEYDFSRIAGADRGLRDGETWQIAGLPAQAIAIPGHTLGHMATHLPSAKWLFTGDTLFGFGCGRLFEGTAEQLYLSLQRLTSLPHETQLFWGHEYTEKNGLFASSVDGRNYMVQDRLIRARRIREKGRPTLPGRISEELATNPFLRVDQTEVLENLGMVGADPMSVFAELRRRRDRF